MNPDGTVIIMDDTAQCNARPCQKGEMHVFYSLQSAVKNCVLLQLWQRKNCHFPLHVAEIIQESHFSSVH